MTQENREATTGQARAAAAGVGDIKSQFEALPLDKKFASLFQMELSTLNEAVKYVADSSMKVFEKLGDTLSDIGSKVEAEAKKAVEVNKDEAKAESTTEYQPPVAAEPIVAEPVIPASDPFTEKTDSAGKTDPPASM